MKNVINLLLENRETIAGLIILVIFVVKSVQEFMLLPKTKKREQVLHFLEFKVSEAESYFGSKTGQLKLKKVYSEFIRQYPICANFVSFERFKDLVDEALDWMKDEMKKNASIEAAING